MPDTLRPRTVRFGSSSGQPVTRRDGVAKVTGTATFAADNHPEGLLHAVFAAATIARGRVTHLDVAAAEAHPGVTHVVTPQNRPPLQGDPDEKPTMFSSRVEVLQDDTVRYAGQPIALVLAETLEAATEGARLLNPRYEATRPARRPRHRRALRLPERRLRPAWGRPARRCRSGAGRGRAPRSTSPTRPPRNITTRWRPTPSSRRGRATG